MIQYLFSTIFSIIISLSVSTSVIINQSSAFTGDIDDTIKSYFYDKKNNTLYYLNNTLTLSIINFSVESNTKVSLNFSENLLNNIPNSWKASVNLETNENFVKQQTLNKIKEKASEIPIIKSGENIYLVDDGGGIVLKIDLKTNLIDRDDNSFASMNKFNGDVFNYKDEIYHFGGYGLYATNSTLLKYSKNYKNWSEIVYDGEFPSNNGIQSFSSLIFDDKYYVIGGHSVINQKNIKNNELIYYDFKTNKWTSKGIINYIFSGNEIITSDGGFFYIYNSDEMITIDVSKLISFSYNKKSKEEFNGNDKIIAFNSHFHEETAYGRAVHTNIEDDWLCNSSSVNYVTANNSSFGTSLFKSYKIKDFVNIESKEKIVLFKERRSRNEFIIPLILVLTILILNTFYKNYNKGKRIIKEKLYSFEDGILLFKTKEISIDENAKMLLELLTTKEAVSSNDIVALLVENGMSMDYASKIKNKTIESLNEKFEFITGLEERFIQTSKSKEDKRIQVLKLIEK